MKFYKITNDNKVVCNVDHIHVCIPLNYFNDNLAVWMGDKIKTLGMFFVEAFGSPTDHKPKLFRMNLSVEIDLHFSENMRLTKNFNNTGDQVYEVFRINKNEVIIDTINHIKTVESTKNFLGFLEKGKLPEDLNYNDILNLFTENARLNGLSLGVPSVLLEAIVGELTRNSKNWYEPFRIVAGKTGAVTGYSALKLKDLPKLSSVFSALAFENITDSMRAGVNMTRTGKEQKSPPIEEAIYF